MRRTMFIIIISIIQMMLFSALTSADPTRVDIVRTELLNKTVYIHYDLYGSDDEYEVKLKVSEDKGKSFQASPNNLSGDVGASVKPGTGKIIVMPVKGSTPQLGAKDFLIDVTPIGETKACPYGMVAIPPGEFMMGCSTGDMKCYSDEKPAHKVRFTKGYCMDKYEVTQGGFRDDMGRNPSKLNKCGRSCPVHNVAWNSAKEYCEFKGKRLPTEAEWEYAARGGTTTMWYWGNEMNESFAWYQNNSNGTIHKVGMKRPNGYGLYDILGNVFEWVNDWFGEDYYASGQTDNPQGPDSGQFHVMRGGSWYIDIRDLRVSTRLWLTTDFNNRNVGFRCAKSL